MFDILNIFLALIIFSISILLAIFWIWMIIDCATKEPNQGNEKIVWLIIILLANWIGAAIYFFVRRPKRMIEVGE